MLAPDGNLSVKEGALDAPWALESAGVQSFQLCNDRIAVLDAAGNLSVAEGPRGSPMSLESAGVQSFQLCNDRIAVLDSAGNLSVKDGVGRPMDP